MPGVTYEAARAEDAPKLADLRVRAMRASLEAVGRFDEQRARERLLSGFAAHRTTLVRVDGELAGFFVAEDCGPELALRHLYVDPPFQSKGLGSLVLQRIIEQADRQRRRLTVVALAGSGSNRFYERHGFVVVDRSAFDIHYAREPG